MSSPLTGLVALDTVEAALENGPEKRVHQHPGETYQCSEREEERKSSPDRAAGRNDQRSHQRAQVSSEGDRSVGASEYRPARPKQPGRNLACNAHRGRPGVCSGCGKASGQQPHSQSNVRRKKSPQRRHTAVGVDLPEITTGAFGIQLFWWSSRLQTGDQATGNEKSGQYRAADPSRAVQYRETNGRTRDRSAGRQGTGAPSDGGRRYADQGRQVQRQVTQWPFASARRAARIRARSSWGQLCRRPQPSTMARKLCSNSA
jgi:hypothetical protein